jgi:hypothetical protein
MSSSKKSKPLAVTGWELMVIGSNRVINPSGVLMVLGDPQINVERGADGRLLVSVDLYDASAKHIARLRRNAWAFKQSEYKVQTSPHDLTLTRMADGAVILRVDVKDPKEVHIVEGRFYTKMGSELEITPTYVRIGGLTLSGNTIDVGGRAISIHEGGIGIG